LSNNFVCSGSAQHEAPHCRIGLATSCHQALWDRMKGGSVDGSPAAN
jgi:hypothetical protein